MIELWLQICGKMKSLLLQRDQEWQPPGILSMVAMMKKEEEKEKIKPQEILQDGAGSVQGGVKVGLQL